MSKYTDIRRQVVFKAVAGGGGSTTLTVGTTPIVGGTVGRIFFQGTGDVLAQSSNLFWDNTTSKLSLGGGTTPLSAILIQSSTANSDALSLSLSFKRTNSANTNTTWSAVRSYNSADTLVGLFGTFQETAGGGSRFTVSTSTNTTSTAVTERFRVASDGKTSLGQSILGGAALDVHALGALSTDLAFRVRNSANTYNILEVKGDGNIKHLFNTSSEFKFEGNGGSMINIIQTSAKMWIYGFGGSNNWLLGTNATNTEYNFMLGDKANMVIGSATPGSKPNEANTRTMYVINGTAPTSSLTDSFSLYSADITAGNAAPHFRTENGNIIKLYRETTAITAGTYASVGGSAVSSDDTFGGYSIGQIVAALKAQGLLA